MPPSDLKGDSRNVDGIACAPLMPHSADTVQPIRRLSTPNGFRDLSQTTANPRPISRPVSPPIDRLTPYWMRVCM